MRAFSVLLAAVWAYSEGRRRSLVLCIFLFVCANLLLLVEPIVIGGLLNTIQGIATLKDPMHALGLYFLMMVGIQFGFWMFHGPARVMENASAFHARINFADRLFRIVTSLPVQWHKDHHSGEVINRMRKSTGALYSFLSDGFQLIEMMMRLVGSVIALFLLFPIAGFIAIAIPAI
jgi:ATP-binding cassette subfamily B protein